MSDLTLYQLCLWKTAWLLKNSFWNQTYINEGVRSNPFCGVPSPIVDDLVTCVLQLTTSGSLKVTDLYHLLTSGRVEHFKLDDILLSSEEFVSILMSLSVACQNLHSLTLRNVFFSDHYASLHQAKAFMKKAAVECVLGISPLLEVIESCVEFDLKAIRNCDRLRVLKLHFVPKSVLFGFLEKVDGRFVSHNCLSVLEVFEDLRHTSSYMEVSTVMKYSPNLTQINTDISRCLEFLHEAEMFDGTLDTQYKLRKCCLGSVYLPVGAATLNSVHIATLTCPLMEDIDILVNDHEAVYAVSDFPNLSSLLIQWETPDGGDFQLSLQVLLEKIGPNLKNLHIINFYNVDLAVIATKCHKIEELKVEFHSEFRAYDVPSECFKCLKTVHLESMETQNGCTETTLLMLLSNSVNLTRLHLHCASNLSDTVLVKVFQKNSLSKVKDAIILDSSLTEEGVRNLIEHMKDLEFFHFSSSRVLFEEAAIIVHSINPHVIMRSDFD